MPLAHRPTPAKAARPRQPPFLSLLQLLLLATLLLGLPVPAQATRSLSYTHDRATQVTTYVWDALNRLSQIQAAGHTSTHSYDKSSRITQTTHSGGITTNQTWDGAGRIQSIRHSKAAATLQSTSYRYDKNGNRTEQTQQFGDDSSQAITTSYQYDQADRLIGTSDSQGQIETYTLDAAGNKTHISRSGHTSTASGSRINSQPNGSSELSYDARGQIQSLATDEYQISYQWDGSGHLTQETISGSANPGQNHSRTYQWNAAGQLIGISQGATPLASYRYSGQSLRDKTQTASGTSHTVWDGEFAYLLQDQDNHTLTRTEHHGLNPLVVHADSAYKEVLLKDGLQSVTASVQAADSTLQSQSEYDAWGQRAQQGSSASRHGYTGHLHDSESGLIYARARYYNPMLGRFISQDPLEGILNSPITWNAYLYGNGNPLIYIDPTGEASVSSMIDDAAEGCGVWSCAGWALLKGAYTVSTLGFSTVHDPIRDAYDEGEISLGEYAGYGIGGGGAVAGLNLLTGRLGGTALAATTSLGGRTAVAATVGATSGALTDAVEQATQLNTGLRENYDLSQTVTTAALGGAIGGGSPVVAEVVSSASSAVRRTFSGAAPTRTVEGSGAATNLVSEPVVRAETVPVPKSFFGNTRLEAETLQLQGLSRSEAFTQIRRFNAGNADGYLFHFTHQKGGRGIVKSNEIFATQRGLGGAGVYTGTTPIPNFFQRYFSPVGWGVNPGSNVRIPLRISPEIDSVTRTPLLPRWTRIVGEGQSIPISSP